MVEPPGSRSGDTPASPLLQLLHSISFYYVVRLVRDEDFAVMLLDDVLTVVAEVSRFRGLL